MLDHFNFMPEDTKAGMIQAFLDSYSGDTICSKQLYKEALNHAFDEPKQWEIREINEIMNQCVIGWNYFSNPRMFAGYGRQKGWEREQKAKADACALTTDTGNGAGKTLTDSCQYRSRWNCRSKKIAQILSRCILCCYPVAGLVAGKNPITVGFFSFRQPKQQKNKRKSIK